MSFNAKMVFKGGLELTVPLKQPEARVTLKDYSVNPPRHISVQGQSDGQSAEVFVSFLVKNDLFRPAGKEAPYIVRNIKSLGRFGIGETFVQPIVESDGRTYELVASYPEPYSKSVPDIQSNPIIISRENN